MEQHQDATDTETNDSRAEGWHNTITAIDDAPDNECNPEQGAECESERHTDLPSRICLAELRKLIAKIQNGCTRLTDGGADKPDRCAGERNIFEDLIGD